MSNLEHLFENTVMAVKDGKVNSIGEFIEFAQKDPNVKKVAWPKKFKHSLCKLNDDEAVGTVAFYKLAKYYANRGKEPPSGPLEQFFRTLIKGIDECKINNRTDLSKFAMHDPNVEEVSIYGKFISAASITTKDKFTLRTYQFFELAVYAAIDMREEITDD